MQTAESSADAYPLDERQQRRILDGVLAGPVVELLGELVRRLPDRPRKAANEAEYQRAVERRLHPMELDIALSDQSGSFGYKWPGTALTVDDLRRLATLENTTQLRMTRLLHHSVRVAHHLFQAIVREIMVTSAQTGVSVRELLQQAIAGNGQAGGGDQRKVQVDAAACPAVASTSPVPEGELPDVADFSFPPIPMSKRTAAKAPAEGLSEDRLGQLEDQMRLLQETMDTLIAAIDELRDEMVHALRNLPDRLPPPLQIHSLPLDPTDPEFAQRVNDIPPDVMARLRDEAVGGPPAESTPAAAAEGEPSPADVIEEPVGNGRPRGSRQTRLFA
jgi:hypothetical protein